MSDRIAKAEVNRLGDWSPRSEPPIEFNPPLILPGGNAPAPRRPLTPQPPPTEAELRLTLADAIAHRHAARTKAAAAEAAHDRATAHLERTRATLDAFAGLDDAITAHTVEALRCDAGRLDPTMTEDMELAVADRATAQIAMDAAERAATQLQAEAAAARDALDQADRATHRAAMAVLGLHATAIATRHDELLASAERLRALLVAYDRIGTHSGVRPSAAALDVLRRHDVNMLRAVDTSAWTHARDALLADADAEVSVG